MTIRERAKHWNSQAAIAGARPEWWQRAIIWALLRIRYDKSLLTIKELIKRQRDIDATRTAKN